MIWNHLFVCLILQLLTIPIIYAADDGGLVPSLNENITFPFNCSTRAFCKDLRQRIPTEQERYIFIQDVAENDSHLIFLNNSLNEQLVVSIQSIANYMFRVIIEEPDKHRHKLQYVLEREPLVQRRKFVIKDQYEVVLTYDEEKCVRILLNPFKIEFYYRSVFQTVIDGDRLIMENTNESQAFAFNVRFPQAKRLIGLHEHADSFNLRHTADLSVDPYRLRNTDYATYQYDLNSTKSMYGAVPLLYGFGSDYTSAVFVHNAAEMYVDTNTKSQSAYFMVDGGTFDLFVLLGPSLKDTVRQYMNLTGKPHLPQRWALGYHQCRVSYENISDVKNVITQFDENNFPLDSVWLVREATDNQRWFLWNQTSFKNITTELFSWADEKAQRKFTVMTESNIKVDPTYKLYSEGLANDYFVKYANGSNFINICWAGNSTWVDFFNPKALDWYSKQYLYENFEQTRTLAGTWNDMGEPALFDNLYERSLPYSTVHYGDIKHRDVHNAYGLMQVVASHKGLIMRDNGTMRPFILTRAAFAGTQRYALKWSGDNEGKFEDLQITIPMTMVANLAGINFYGADIPGFRYGASEELTIRWYQVGSWIPFFRAHAWSGPRREPYTFNNGTQALLRDAMYWRYKHIFYWYTIFYEHTLTGDPIVRPLIYEYPDDGKTYDLNDQFLVGSDILVSSVSYSNVSKVKVYLPGDQQWVQVLDGIDNNTFKGGSWYNITVNMSFIPIFYKEGSVIPRYENNTRSTADMNNSISLYAVIGDNNVAEGKIYIDDNESFDYIENNHFLYYGLTVSLSSEDEAKIEFQDLMGSSVKNGLNFTVDSLVVYKVNDNKTVSNKIVFTHTKEGISLRDINVMSNRIITL